nr:hypothetical protein [Tanacetum cinerariifolium]
MLQDREKFIQDTQTFLEKFNRYSFGVTPRVLSIAWERISKIKYLFTKPEEIPELMCKLLEDVRNIHVELAVYINSPSWNRPTFFFDNDEEESILYKECLEKSSDAIAPVLPTEELECSLSMRYEHLSTIPETKSDEVIESSAKNLLPILSDDDESLSDEDVLIEEFKVYSNPLFDDEEIHSDKLDPHCFNAESDFVESLSNHDTLIDSFSKFDFLEEFSGVLLPTSIADEERIRREHAEEEIDIFTGTDELSPSSIESDDYDSEGEIYFLEELLVDDSISLSENKLYYFDHQDDPSFPRSPPELPDVFFDLEPDSGKEITAVMNNFYELNEDECFDPGGEIDVFTNIEDDDYFPFMFVIRIFLPYLIYPEVSPLLLSPESEDTIFDPGDLPLND